MRTEYLRIVEVMVVSAGVGSGFGIECRLDRIDLPGESLNHRSDHVIRADADALAEQLHGQVAVAEMPGDPRSLSGIRRSDLHERFGSRTHPHDAAIDRKSVAIAEAHRLGKVEQEILSPLGMQ
jgi:hypothetical protein